MATMKTLNGYGFNATEFNGKTSDSYLLKTDTAADSAKLGGKAPEYYINPKNLLDNSDFRNPVNQRGIYSTGDGGYIIDRWYFSNSNFTGNVTITQSVNGITITNDAGADRVAIIQKIIDKNYYDGKYTAVAKTTDGLAFSYAEVEDAENGICRVAFWFFSGTTVVWAALYEGSYTAETLPPYVPKGYAAELAECQRYFYKMKSYWKWVSAGICETSTKAFIPIVLPREMRIVPTVYITNPSLIKVKCGNTGLQIPSDIHWTYGILDARIMQMEATVTGATGGNVAFLYFDNGGEITFSADL